MSTQKPHERYQRFLETLTPGSLNAIHEYVTDDVHFKDPFNDVHNAANMTRVFQHMFENVRDIRFIVHTSVAEGDRCLMAWRFEGRLRGRAWTFDGTSAIRFAEDGRVCEHIDYWDAAGNFYERLPLIGWLLATLRRRLAVR